MRSFLFAVFFLIATTSCSKIIFGSGELFIWNGSDRRTEVTIDGRSSATLSLVGHSGARIKDAVAGTYRIVERRDGKEITYNFELKDGTSVIVNLGGHSCFVRTDISGMYQSGRERVRLLETYDKSDVVSLDLLLPVMPGEPLPATRPKSTYAFQRLSDVPCNMLNNEAKMIEYIRRQR
ncbi:MAG: hypothetical protein JW841_05680 [Deltaproteobacteria bacterium]|nr:hypothetical protein [Deltaproteobacteria bacterium]